MFTVEGYQLENKEWVLIPNVWEDAKTHELMFGDEKFEVEDQAIKCAWRARVLLDVSVRLLKDGQVIWSDDVEQRNAN